MGANSSQNRDSSPHSWSLYIVGCFKTKSLYILSACALSLPPYALHFALFPFTDQ